MLMSILDRIEIVCADVRDVPCDLLVMKYADDHYGADLAVAERLDVNIHVPKGHRKLLVRRGQKLGAARVLYLGVGELFKFRYHEIRQFAYATLVGSQEIEMENGTLAVTIHGPGYGLDEREAFLSQLQGYLDLSDYASEHVRRLLIVERDEQRAGRLADVLSSLRAQRQDKSDGLRISRAGQSTSKSRDEAIGSPQPVSPPTTPMTGSGWGRIQDKAPRVHIDYSDQQAEKPKLFVAMPFADKYLDEYHIAFVEAAHANGYICERLDLENYLGDVIDEIFKRIRNSVGVVALLNENNPNVFLEVGYAMALEKPVILVAREDLEVAFDLRSQRRQTYDSIYRLRKEMTALIGDLRSAGSLH